jgi:hypothetical protein
MTRRRASFGRIARRGAATQALVLVALLSACATGEDLKSLSTTQGFGASSSSGGSGDTADGSAQDGAGGSSGASSGDDTGSGSSSGDDSTAPATDDGGDDASQASDDGGGSASSSSGGSSSSSSSSSSGGQPCGQLTCNMGCCDKNGVCQPGTATAVCGNLGQHCMDCTTQGLMHTCGPTQPLNLHNLCQ